MKVKNVIMFVAALLMHASVGHALEEYDWGAKIKNTVETVTANSDSDGDENHLVYFYNEVTKTFLNVGDSWGTQVVAQRTGIPFRILKKGNAYTFQTVEVATGIGTNVGYYQDLSTTSTYALFCDRSTNFNFKDANSNDDSRANKHYYYITTTLSNRWNKPTGYLSVSNQTDGIENSIDFITAENSLNANAKWLLVTAKDLKARLNAQADAAKYTDQADATFFIQDYAIKRSGFDLKKSFWKGIPEEGYNLDYNTGDDTDYGNDGGGIGNLLAEFGKYWHMFILGNSKGMVHQRVKVSQPGWYRITCDGFYHADNGSDLEAYLFANNFSILLNSISNTTYQTFSNKNISVDNKTYRVKDGKGTPLIINEGIALYNGAYKNTVMVKVDESNKEGDYYIIDLGIKVTGNYLSSNDRTAFDNFQMTYCCKNAILLDEEYGKENANTSNVRDFPQSLILKRTFTVGKWNSFCLPVNLTKKQVLNAFGSDIKMASLVGILPSGNERIIHFDYINISDKNDNENLIEKDKFYLIKPLNDGMTEVVSTNDYQTKERKFYVIDDVTLNKAVSTDNDFTDKHEYTTKGNSKFDFQWISFRGTYVNLDGTNNNFVWGPSYILKDDATPYGFYHCTGNEKVKAFRCWIHEEGEKAESKISFSFGNFDDVVSSIDQLDENTINTVNTNSKVYNLAGQQVSKNYKGLVIKNGKKYYNK